MKKIAEWLIDLSFKVLIETIMETWIAGTQIFNDWLQTSGHNTLRFMTGAFFLLQSHPKNKFPCKLSVKINIGILKTESAQDQLVINVIFFIVLWIYLL